MLYTDMEMFEEAVADLDAAIKLAADDSDEHMYLCLYGFVLFLMVFGCLSLICVHADLVVPKLSCHVVICRKQLQT